jgi:hypothetical protein
MTAYRVRWCSAMFVLGLVCVSVAGCSSSSLSDHAPRIVAVGSGQIGAGVPVRIDRPYVFPMRTLCNDSKPDTFPAIKVTSIRTANATGGMKVVDWGIRRRYPGDPYTNADNGGAAPGLVSQFRGFSSSTAVTVPCGPSDQVDQLDVALSISQRLGSMSGVWVYYGTRSKVFSQYAITLCAGKTCPASAGQP